MPDFGVLSSVFSGAQAGFLGLIFWRLWVMEKLANDLITQVNTLREVVAHLRGKIGVD